MPTIAVINESNIADADLALWVNAIQHQLLEDVAPFWTLAASANLVMIPRGFSAPSGSWQVVVGLNTDIVNDLGYHELTNDLFNAQPLGKVFTQTTLGFGQTISRVLSHEIIEMIADPHVNTLRTIGGVTYLAEACDPVHYDALGYRKQGILVSDFVTPRYYELASPSTADQRFAFNTALGGPCPTLPRGGALTVKDPGDGKLKIEVAPDSSHEESQFLAIRDGSRRHRHQMGQRNWRKSTR